MVSKKDFDDGLAKLKSDIQGIIDDSIKELREHIINGLIDSNLQLQNKVSVLEQKVHQLEVDLQENLQHNRLNNIVISGIPRQVEHKDLKEKAIGILNTCLKTTHVVGRDFEACHRISVKSSDVVCKLINREHVEETLQNWKMLENINLNDVGLPENTKLYVSVHLSPYNSKIAYHCRQLKKERKILKTSSRKGKVRICVKDDDDDEAPPVWKSISHINDLKVMFPEDDFS